MADVPSRKITIFVSSPTDVMAERERSHRVIDRLRSRFRDHVAIDAVFFEEKEKYYTADKSFQDQIPDAAKADLVISIFWSKLGSELAPDLFGTMPDGRAYPGGAVYELMRALAAKRSGNVPDILVYRKVADTGISVTDPQQRRLMTAQLDAFEVFWRQWFVSEEGHFRAGFQTFHGTDQFEHLLEGHLRAWLDEKGLLGKEVIWRIAERGSPFRGLEPYEPQHAEVFFGREREVDRGRERLLAAAAGGTAFLLIMGPSGAGKSSLARAGLVTRLTQPGDVAGVDVTRFAMMRPGAADTPQRALADALFQPEALPELVESDFPQPERLAAMLAGEPGAAAAPVLRALARVAANIKTEKGHDRPVEARLLLLVDQLEELFSATVTDAARASLMRLIAHLARSGRVHVMATLRSSSYGLLAQEPELVALKDAGATLDVAVPGPEVLADIVRRPAAAAGLVFEQRRDKGSDRERSLDEVLLTAAGGNADALPLLGFTLQSLFASREGERLTFAAYEQLGGLEGAIGRAAEQAFDGLDAAAQATLPQLLRGLAEASRRGTGLALRDMPLAAAPEGTPLRALIDALVAARVLLIHGEGRGAMLRLAHDAVLRGWTRARDITTKEEDFYRIREDVAAAEQRWHGRRRPDLLLAPGLPLAEAQSLRGTYGAELPADLLAFIDASTRREQWRQRRGYALAAVFGLVAVAAVAAGFLAWQQQRIADQQRGIATAEAKRAERNFDAAKTTIDAVIFDLAQDLKDVEGMRAETVRRILERAEAAVGRLASRTDNDPAVRRSQAWMFNQFSDTYLRLGATSLALDYARKAAEAFRELAARDPGNTEHRRDLSTSLNRIGSVLEVQGDLTGALAAYRESLGIMREIVAGNPGNAGWRNDLAQTLINVGDVLTNQADSNGALAVYRESLDIRRDLVAKNPDNTEWRADLAWTLGKVGDVLGNQGDAAGALAAYREGVDIMRALVAKDPGNTLWANALVVSLDDVATKLFEEGDFAGALTILREAVDLERRLVAKDPGNAQWRSMLAAGLSQFGLVLRMQGDLAGALIPYRESLEITRGLVAKDPGNTVWQALLALAQFTVGELLQAQGDLAGALAEYREGIDIYRALIGKDVSNSQWSNLAGLTLIKIAEVLQAQGDHAGALAAQRESIETYRRLAARDPSNTSWSSSLALGLVTLADAMQAQGDFAGALATRREYIDIYRRLIARDPSNTNWSGSLALGLGALANSLQAQGDVAGAIAARREVINIYRALLAKGPTNKDWLAGLSFAVSALGQALTAQGDHAGAIAARRESVGIMGRLVAENPNNTLWRSQLFSDRVLLAALLDGRGNELFDHGDIEGALAAYRESVAILKAGEDPSQAEALQTERQGNLALAHDKIGNILFARGKLDEALAAYHDSLAVRAAEATKYPDDATRQNSLVISYSNVASVLLAQGKPDEAIAVYRKSRAITAALALKDPGNGVWQDALFEVDIKLGELLAQQGKADEAFSAYRAAIATAKAMAEKSAGEEKWQIALAQGYAGVSVALVADGKTEEGIAAYRDSVAIIRRLLADRPDDGAGQSLLISVHVTIGEALADRGKFDEALLSYREANAVARKLMERDRENDAWRHQLALSDNDIGNALADLGKHEEALIAYREANAIAKALVAKDADNVEWQHDLGISYRGIGIALAARDRPAEALVALRASLAIVDGLIAKDPNNAQWRDERRDRADRIGGVAYSFVLARNFTAALEAADQALAIAPDLIYVYGNRAHALMLLGRVDEARALYLKYRGREKVVGEKSWETSVLDDFAEIRKARLTHPLMAEIEKLFAARR
jgi:tetratricopeptide (TPR) repeat protein